MCHINDTVNYDRITGVPSNSYYNSFHVLQSPTGEFYSIDGWERGAAEYTVEKDGVYVSFPITIRYKETDEVQQAGYVKCMLSVSYKSYYVYIIPKLCHSSRIWNTAHSDMTTTTRNGSLCGKCKQVHRRRCHY